MKAKIHSTTGLTVVNFNTSYKTSQNTMNATDSWQYSWIHELSFWIPFQARDLLNIYNSKLPSKECEKFSWASLAPWLPLHVALHVQTVLFHFYATTNINNGKMVWVHKTIPLWPILIMSHFVVHHHWTNLRTVKILCWEIHLLLPFLDAYIAFAFLLVLPYI